MARTDTLTNFLTDVADSIREKNGNSEPIACEDFDTEIESIQTGGSLQTKSITITNNGTTNITPDSGYDGMSRVSVETNVSGSSTVNVYVQNDEPTSKNGVWIKTTNTYENRYLEYDPRESTCGVDRKSMTTRLQEAATVCIGEYIYIFGGALQNGAKNTAYKFTTTGRFANISRYDTLTSMPYSAYGLGAVVYNDDIYIFGGRNGGTTYDYAYKFDVSEGTYTQLTSMPEHIGQFGITISGNTVYIVGGTANGGSTRKNTLYAYNIDTDTWSTLSNMPANRNCLAVQCIDGCIYSFGGFDGSAYSNAYKYTISTNTWVSITNYPLAVYGVGSGKVGKFIYLFGGCNAYPTYYPNVYIYDTVSNKYFQIGELASKVARIYNACSVRNNTIYVVGGELNNSASSTSASNQIQRQPISLSGDYQNNSIIVTNGNKHKVLLSNNTYAVIGNVYHYSTTNGLTDITSSCYYGDGSTWRNI